MRTLARMIDGAMTMLNLYISYQPSLPTILGLSPGMVLGLHTSAFLAITHWNSASPASWIFSFHTTSNPAFLTISTLPSARSWTRRPASHESSR